MRYAYPVVLEPERDGTAVNVAFPDVPEALTWGDDKREALQLAQDCLVTALGWRVGHGQPIPRPTPARGRPMIAVPPLVAAKLALYTAMREQGITAGALAEWLGVTEKVVHSMLHLKRRAHIAHLERALAQLGVQLEVRVREAA
jgi:antitoxin HicB